VYVCMYVYVHRYVCTYMYICMYTHACMCVHFMSVNSRLGSLPPGLPVRVGVLWSEGSGAGVLLVLRQ